MVEVPEPFDSTYHLYSHYGQLPEQIKRNYRTALLVDERAEALRKAEQKLLEEEEKQKLELEGKTEAEIELERYDKMLVEVLVGKQIRTDVEEARASYDIAYECYKEAKESLFEYYTFLDWVTWFRERSFEQMELEIAWLEDGLEKRDSWWRQHFPLTYYTATDEDVAFMFWVLLPLLGPILLLADLCGVSSDW